jgi:hypothetical protein
MSHLEGRFEAYPGRVLEATAPFGSVAPPSQTAKAHTMNRQQVNGK